MPPRFEDHREHARRIFESALHAADPALALRRVWADTWERRAIDFTKDQPPVLVLAIGKSSLEMAGACLELLPHPAVSTIVTAVPDRIPRSLLPAKHAGRCRIMPADHPLPTNRSFAAALAVQETVGSFAREHGELGVIVALISGGGSSHLPVPAGNLTLDDLRTTGRLLQSAGASITQINCVRRHTEQLKGGRLGTISCPARVQAFIASDVIGDPLDVIASGPFAADASTFGDALVIAERFRLGDRVPRIIAHLRQGTTGRFAETPKPGDETLRFIQHTVICNNNDALLAAADAASAEGFEVTEVSPMRATSAREEGERLASACLADMDRSGPIRTAKARFVGGEPVVDTRDAAGRAGIGGPSQELALSSALTLHHARDRIDRSGIRIAVAAFSTDGVDGPTDAAGAVITGALLSEPPSEGHDAAERLARHDSHPYLDKLGCLLRTGPTGINANHIACSLAYPITTHR